MQLELRIVGTLENGRVKGVRVGGPIGQKEICEQMLQLAKVAVDEFKPPERKIEIATPEQTRQLVGV